MKEQFFSINDLKWKLNNSLNILRSFDWLIDNYVLDFYVEDHWSKLPPSWRNCLENISPEQLCYLLDAQSESRETPCNVWPLNLLALKEAFKQLCIKRQPDDLNDLNRSPLLDHSKLKHIFNKGIKPKKKHELDRMAALCKQICLENPADFVIDFGAGLGHLARVLGFAYQTKVCCLEMQTELNNQAKELDKNFAKLLAKHLPATEYARIKNPTHVNLCLTAHMTKKEFLSVIEKALELTTKTYKFGIIGLHPCGDLGALLIRMFLECKQATFLNFAGCCYQKLTCSNDLDTICDTSTGFFGYPLSEYLKTSTKDTRLSYEAREISCHALELYYERLSLKDYEYLKVHSYRAAAERIIVKHYPELKHSGLKSVKHTPDMKFKDYFYKAVKGLPVENLSEHELDSSVTQNDIFNWRDVVIFYTLRLFFAPLIESVILYDRLLYLLENGCNVQISPIFDPRLSPRNHITTAVKKVDFIKIKSGF